MTLIQVLANENSIHMACDFRLTDYLSGQVVENNAHKLITIARPSILALIGVTGLSSLEGKSIGGWIAERVWGLEGDISLREILQSLREAEEPLSRIIDSKLRCHTFVVGTMTGTQTSVALVSNFELFINGRIRRADSADQRLTISRIKPKGEVTFLTGVAGVVTTDEQEALKCLLRANASDDRIQQQLSDVNVAASHRTSAVSAGCFAASLHATGVGSSRPFLTSEQTGNIVAPGFDAMLRQHKISLRPAKDSSGQPKPIRLVSSSFVAGGSSEAYYREQLKLRPGSAELWNNYGAFLTEVRRHEEAMNAFKKAISLDPSYLVAIANLAKTTWLHSGDLVAAERLYDQASEGATEPAPAWIVSDFAVFYDEGLSCPERAAQLHERARQIQDSPLLAARQGLFLYKGGDDSDYAESIIARSLDQEPNNVEILVLAAQADWTYKKDGEAALEKFNKACSLNPNNLVALRWAADISLVLGQSSSAAYYYRKLIGRGEGAWDIRSNYGLALLLEGKAEGALKQLLNAQKLSPESLPVRVNVAAAMWATGKHDGAISFLRDVLRTSPPPEVELEVLAMLRLALPDSIEWGQINSLIESGVRADGNTLRGMVRNDKQSRKLGQELADLIEGKA